jgi:hypothetical protein
MTHAHGGCLGFCGRGRAWHATKRGGEARAAGDPPMPESGNRPPGMRRDRRQPRRTGELKHLSTRSPKVTTRPGVAASETGWAQTIRVVDRAWPGPGSGCGAVPRRQATSHRAGAGTGRRWKPRPERVRVPYGNPPAPGARCPSTTGTSWRPVGSGVAHHPRQRSRRTPIVHEYREGQVKSPPGGE